MKSEKVLTRYQVQVTPKELSLICAYEAEQHMHKLYEVLQRETGAIGVEYGELFGNYIWYSLNVSVDTEDTRERIITYIEKYIDTCTKIMTLWGDN